jgi:tripartite-type tricarboxylate transporter receptor subunit TctC
VKTLRPLVTVAVAAGLMALGAHDAWAQAYPARVVRLMVSFSAGSGTDTIGRIIAGGMTDVFGQQVIVDNRAGAGGNIGAEIAVKAPPDGYMIMLVNISHAGNVTLYRNPPFDLLRDFAPVSLCATGPAVLVVHPSLPVKSLVEFVKLAKAKPGAINYSSGGAGAFTFLSAELFKAQAGINLLHVPYRSGGEALTSVIGGETSVYFAPVATALPHIRSVRLRALAVTSKKRLVLLPEFPTVAESGYPRYETGNWYGLAVPAKTPKEIIATLRNASVTALNNPVIGRRLTELGYVAIGSQPDEFGKYIKSEVEVLGKIIKAFNLSAD